MNFQRKAINVFKGESTNILRASPRFILLASLFAYLVTEDVIALRFALYFFVSEILSHLLKGATKVVFGKQSWAYRPQGAGNCQGCGVFPQCPKPSDVFASCLDVSNKIGMPSGHSLSSAFAASFWINYIWDNHRGSYTSQNSKILRTVALLILALAVMASRSYLVENCHTIPQILVGATVGGALGVGIYKLDKKYYK